VAFFGGLDTALPRLRSASISQKELKIKSKMSVVLALRSFSEEVEPDRLT
jgi:hypothetical protein